VCTPFVLSQSIRMTIDMFTTRAPDLPILPMRRLIMTSITHYVMMSIIHYAMMFIIHYAMMSITHCDIDHSLCYDVDFVRPLRPLAILSKLSKIRYSHLTVQECGRRRRSMPAMRVSSVATALESCSASSMASCRSLRILHDVDHSLCYDVDHSESAMTSITHYAMT
jgi:hypothetical protein